MFQLLSLRILHVVFGTFWVGTDIFATFLLIPRLRALSLETERAVMGTLSRSLPPVLTFSSIVTVITGVWLAAMFRGWNVSWVLASNWSVTMLVAFIGTMAAVVIGFALLGPLTARYEKLRRVAEGKSPTPEESRQLQRVAARVTAMARVNTVLLMIVLVAMAVARYV
jgi:uncharacterized membrane protein